MTIMHSISAERRSNASRWWQAKALRHFMSAMVALLVLLESVASPATGWAAQCPPPENGDLFGEGEQWRGPFSHRWTYVPPGSEFGGHQLPFPGGVYIGSFQLAESLGFTQILRKRATPGAPWGCNFPTEEFPSAEFPNLAWHSLGSFDDGCNYYGPVPAELGVVYCDPTPCGNTVKEPWEECDDGNTVDGDGCDASCQQEGVCAGSHQAVLEADPDCSDGEGAGCDRVTVTVRMSTPNVAEDQGNVSLQLVSKSTGDVLHVVTVFNVTSQFTYTNTRDGDQIVGKWVGQRNGNESCAFSVSKLGTNNPFLHEAKYEAADAAKQSLRNTILWSTLGVACGLSPCKTVVPRAAAAIAGGAATNAAMYADEREMADDPPDPDYETVFLPVLPPPLPAGFPVEPGPGISAALAEALNRSVAVDAEAAAYAIATQRTIQKMAGAYRAGDDDAEARQHGAFAVYARRVGALVVEQADRAWALREVLTAESFPSVAVAPADVEAMRQHFVATGLGTELTQALLALGASQATLDSAWDALRTVDTSTIAGAFPQSLVDTETVAARLALGKRFGVPGSFLCYRSKLATGGSSGGVPATVVDRFGVGAFSTRPPTITCNVVGFDNVDDQLTAPFDERHHLVGHTMKRTTPIKPIPGLGTTHVVDNRFQRGLQLTLRKESHVLIASGATLGDQGTAARPGPLLDDFKCFTVTSRNALPLVEGDGLLDDVRDQVTEQSLVIGKPRHLCIPASFEGSDTSTRVGAFTCYAARPTAKTPTVLQSVSNEMTGQAVMRVGKTSQLCVPSVLDPPTIAVNPNPAATATAIAPAATATPTPVSTATPTSTPTAAPFTLSAGARGTVYYANNVPAVIPGPKIYPFGRNNWPQLDFHCGSAGCATSPLGIVEFDLSGVVPATYSRVRFSCGGCSSRVFLQTYYGSDGQITTEDGSRPIRSSILVGGDDVTVTTAVNTALSSGTGIGFRYEAVDPDFTYPGNPALTFEP